MTDNEILNDEKTMTFYSPEKLKVTQIELLTIDPNYYMQKFQIEASNDNETWTTIVSGEITANHVGKGMFCKIPKEFQTPDDKTGWNYIRLNCISHYSPDAPYVAFPKVFITAEEYYYTGKISEDNIIVTDVKTYNAIFKQYGFCNAFAISGDCDIILPTWNGYQTPMNDTIPVRGNGMALGLTNGISTLALANGQNAAYASDSGYGSLVGSVPGTLSVVNQTLGITEYAAKSGIVADASSYPKDNFYWCIQVFNAATELSTQNSDILASQMQMKAQTNLANVTNPVQAFKDMSISWGMPDYSAGMDITGQFSTGNSSYTVEYDCYIIGYAIVGYGLVSLYSKSGCTYEDGLNLAPYLVMSIDAQDIQGDTLLSDHVYCPSGMTLYNDYYYPIKGKLIMYPLKGADKESTLIEI